MSLTLYNNTTGNKTYYFKTVTGFTRTMNYNLISIALPGGDSSTSINSSLLGVTQNINVTFEITSREVGSQSYDGSTVTGSPTSIYDEAEYLYKQVNVYAGDKYTITRTGLVSYSYLTSINKISIPELGTEPSRFICGLELVETIL